MKISAIIIALVASSIFSFGQDCKFTVNKRDEFTGDNTNSIVTRIDRRFLTWTSSKIGQKYFIEILFVHAGSVNQPLTSNDTVFVKLQNGRVLHLMPSHDIQPVFRNTLTSTSRPSSYAHSTSRTTYSSTATRTISESLTYYTPVFEIGREILEELSKSPITRLRFNLTGKPEDIDLLKRGHHRKGCQRIMADSKCILAIY